MLATAVDAPGRAVGYLWFRGAYPVRRHRTGCRIEMEKYLGFRVDTDRLADHVKEHVHHNTKWAAPGPNGERLWGRTRLTVGEFMHILFVQGALQGKTPPKPSSSSATGKRLLVRTSVAASPSFATASRRSNPPRSRVLNSTR